ncbi:hypothetical protein QYF61_026100 [Mycteria americana]|uniref:Uncharacterized protein n=1 Tax=Mycteria americana TaxID=33587 RepID=A0AAN7P6A6_MYCAM|nr:hypothetical protein QYF61_026100 [Mycteria americana]
MSFRSFPHRAGRSRAGHDTQLLEEKEEEGITRCQGQHGSWGSPSRNGMETIFYLASHMRGHPFPASIASPKRNWLTRPFRKFVPMGATPQEPSLLYQDIQVTIQMSCVLLLTWAKAQNKPPSEDQETEEAQTVKPRTYFNIAIIKSYQHNASMQRKMPLNHSPPLNKMGLFSLKYWVQLAKQPQVPQPFLISLVLQSLHQLCCPSLDTLQPLNVSLVVGGPKLNTAFEVRPHQCRVQGHDHFPSPAGHTSPDTSQDAIGLLGRLGTLLAHVQPAVNQHPQEWGKRDKGTHRDGGHREHNASAKVYLANSPYHRHKLSS